MLTARMIATEHRPREKVLISRAATRTGGSMIGVLPEGKRVPLGALLQGLLLVSGNDAATALAEHDAVTVERFVRRMNETAARLGLECSRFGSPHGLIDRGNHSCPRDLATLAKRGGRELGVVLLHSPNPLEQVPKLLELGAEA